MIWHYLKYVCIVALIAIVGCASQQIARQSTGELIGLVGNPQQADSYRFAVLDQLLARSLDDSQRDRLGQVLSQVAGSIKNSPDFRTRAVELIVERYASSAPAWLSEAILNTPEPDVRLQILHHLEVYKDPNVLPNLVVLLADEPNDKPLPQSDVGLAVQRIAGKDLQQVCLDQLTHEAKLPPKMAALTCMVRMEGQDQAKNRVRQLPANEFLDEVQFWVSFFDYLPTNTPRMLMCHLQKNQLKKEDFERLQQRFFDLKQRESYHFNVRDTHWLLTIGDVASLPSRQSLTERIQQRLDGLTHTKRPASYPGCVDDYPEDFASQRNHMPYNDLLCIEWLLEALAAPPMTEELRLILKADRADIQSEAGGLCFLDRDTQRAVFRSYAPGSQLGDKQYVESWETLTAGVLSLARWHCHADPWRGAEVAGPGVDDMKFAAYVNSPVVILTYIDDKIFNVDYLSPEGVVIDLGNY